MNTTLKLFIAIAAVGALSGCGLRGPLERPDPIFDSPSAQELEPADNLPGGSIEDSLDEPIFEDDELSDDELDGGPDGL